MNKQHEGLIIKDFLVSREEFSLEENTRHGYLQTLPQPKQSELSKYYESDDYISHTDSKKGLLAFLYQQVKGYSLNKKVSTIKKLNSGSGNLLDIGAGTGDFLKEAKDKGWNVSGVEPNEKARGIAAKKNIQLYDSMDQVLGQKFDVVTLWHVLEHLPNLEASIHKIESLVNSGGTLIIAVPNFNSHDAVHYKEFWAAYDVPRHLWHFSQSSIRSLFSSEFKLVKTKPMIFDAFYVSLLSEKHKTGNAFSLRAFWIGFRSNLAAMKSTEYSSLIYCFKKTE
ncbi:MAG: class I SAM-dependent methyltransferase [Flavobacteriaceae bacterium]|nr:class I SAM-dependent methyltransferase [Flavobacteriaceae bacterium]